MPLPASMDATWLDGSVQFNGQELRRADSGLFVGEGSGPLGVYGGIARHNDNSLAVTVNASDLITIQPGACAIPGNAGVGNGVYRTALGAAETGQLAARNATNPRMDRVIFRVLDTSVVGAHGAYTGRIEVLTGTPNATPANGMVALPTLAIELARITVPATGGGVATVDSSWRQYLAAIGGELPVATAARLPSTPNAKWMKAVAIDTGTQYTWNGTAWVDTFGVEFFNLQPAGAWIGVSTMRRRRGVVTIKFEITRDSQSGTGPANAPVTAQIPAGWRPIDNQYGLGAHDLSSGAYVAWYITATGFPQFVFGRGAGAGTNGSHTYICDQVL